MKNSFFLFLILFGIVRSQIDYNINYELRLSIDEDGYESRSFRNFENYFDLNFYFDDLYLYSLLKYNNPPIIGSETKDIDDLIEKTIKSIFNQTKLPDELILIDDGSTDDTVEILEK